MQIDHYIEFTNGTDVVRRVPVEAVALNKKNFCKPQMENDLGEMVPVCQNWQKADRCHECLDLARKLYKRNVA